MRSYRYLIGFLFLLILASSRFSGSAQENKPFIMPVEGQSSLSTWILIQPYGNTSGAFVNGASSYSAGQYLHFGIDISMPCGTRLVSVGDGVVDGVDNLSRGSRPHNVLLRFPDLNLIVLYGHMLERASLTVGDPIYKGDFVGYSGDPTGDCDARPHLHLEVRSINYGIAYNPILYIDAPWHSLEGLNVLARSPFQRDLTNARRWMDLEDQPEVQFGGRRLNNYSHTYPEPFNRRAPASTLPDRPFSPVGTTWSLRHLGAGGCCAGAWWHPTDSERLYIIDGAEGQLASVYEIQADGNSAPVALQNAPPPTLSGDGTHEIIYESNKTVIRRLSDGKEWQFLLSGRFPSLSPDNRKLLWSQGDPTYQVSTIDLEQPDPVVIWNTQGTNTSARWLDGEHVLISERASDGSRFTTLTVVRLADGSSYTLGTWYNIRSLQIAPGGQRLIFFSAFNPDPANNGVFALELQEGASANRLPWFSDYRWRDAESLFYITFDPATDIQQLHHYHMPSGESKTLTDPNVMPFTIANGDWSVAPNGNAIIFQEARDGNMWLLEAVDELTKKSSEEG